MRTSSEPVRDRDVAVSQGALVEPLEDLTGTSTGRVEILQTAHPGKGLRQTVVAGEGLGIARRKSQ